MWFDDWPSAYAQLGNLNPKMIDRVPVEQRPSPGNYIRRNSAAQIADRFAKGFDRQAHNFFLPEGTIEKGRKLQVPLLRLPLRLRGAFPLALGAFAIALAIANRKRLEEAAVRDQRRAWLWLAGVAFAVHFAAFAFYTPIAGGARFIMSLYAPVLAALALAIETHRVERNFGWRSVAYSLFQVVFAGVMLWHVVWLSTVTRFGEARGAF
jgi:hypothetical protein